MRAFVFATALLTGGWISLLLATATDHRAFGYAAIALFASSFAAHIAAMIVLVDSR